jgi:hypothetical protein
MKTTFFYVSTVCIFLHLLSCNRHQKEDDIDLINRYLDYQADLFDSEGFFYLLVFQNPPITCYQERHRHDFQELIPHLMDSLNNPQIVILSSNKQTVTIFDSVYSENKQIEIRFEDPEILNSYGFTIKPQLFKIEGLKVKNWKYIPSVAYGCK